MMAPTHMAAGMLTGYAVSVAAGLPLVSAEAGVLVLLGMGAALLPDVDHPKSLIRQRTGCIGLLAGGWFGHRGFTHTLPALALLGLIVALIAPAVVFAAVMAGYASHLLLDAFTRSGVPLAWPLTRRPVRLLPRPLQVRTGGWSEAAFLMAMLGMAVGIEAARLRF